MINDIALKDNIKKKIEPFNDCIVPIPKTKEELDERFSLKNDDVVMDNIDFKSYNVSDFTNVIVPLPKNKEELNSRFY